MFRHLFSSFLRLTERSQAFMIAISITSGVFSVLSTHATPYLGEALSQIILFSTALLAVAALVFSVFQSFNIWKLLPPRYYGASKLSTRLVKEILASRAIFWGTDSIVRIDALATLNWLHPFIDNIIFSASDPFLNSAAGHINAAAFRGTIYGLSKKNKTKRNTKISMKNPISFAMVQEHNMFRGLASTFPINLAAENAYISGRLSDNEIGSNEVVAVGDDVAAILIFLVAANPDIPTTRHYGVLKILTYVCILQIVLIGMSSPANRTFRIYVANSEAKMKAFLQEIGFQKTPYGNNADQQEIFSLEIRLKNRKSAIEQLKVFSPKLYKSIFEKI